MLRKPLLLSFFLSSAALGQTFDTGNNAALKGDYFVREVLITAENTSGTITSAASAMGVATFNGAGSYKFSDVSGKTATGSYGAATNGLLYVQSFVDSTQKAFGGLAAIGPSAFVASATEGSSADLIVAIPAGTTANAASLTGSR